MGPNAADASAAFPNAAHDVITASPFGKTNGGPFNGAAAAFQSSAFNSRGANNGNNQRQPRQQQRQQQQHAPQHSPHQQASNRRGRRSFQPAPSLNMVSAWARWDCLCGWSNRSVAKLCERTTCELARPGLVLSSVATNQPPPPDAPPPGAGVGIYLVVNGVNQWLDGNRAQRKKQ